jgi:hypothetical protein
MVPIGGGPPAVPLPIGVIGADMGGAPIVDPPAPGGAPAMGADIVGGGELGGLEALELLPLDPPQPAIVLTARPSTTSDKRFIALPLCSPGQRRRVRIRRWTRR